MIELSAKSTDLNVPSHSLQRLLIILPNILFSRAKADDLTVFLQSWCGSNTYSTYPFNPSNFGSIAQRYNMAATYVSALTGLNGSTCVYNMRARCCTMGYCNPNPCQYKFFVGASTGEPLYKQCMANASAGKYSFINRKRYYSNFTGEPDVLVGYKEMLFNIAEGITRGWVTGSAETYYKNGITESMNFYGIDVQQVTTFTAYFLPNGANCCGTSAGIPI